MATKDRCWVGQSPPGPEWDGRKTTAQRYLFYSEQGLGDTIQFSRFASIVASQGREVFLAVQPVLVELLEHLKGVDVVENGQTLPEYDVHLPLISLPHVLGGVDPETTREIVPYLSADSARVLAWARKSRPMDFGSASCGKEIRLQQEGVGRSLLPLYHRYAGSRM